MLNLKFEEFVDLLYKDDQLIELKFELKKQEVQHAQIVRLAQQVLVAKIVMPECIVVR